MLSSQVADEKNFVKGSLENIKGRPPTIPYFEVIIRPNTIIYGNLLGVISILPLYNRKCLWSKRRFFA